MQRWIGLALVVGMATTVAAQRGRGGAPAAPARNGSTERVTVGARDVSVYLPPSYGGADAMRRFPVVYLISERPFETLKVADACDRLAAAQGFSEPIVVFADASAIAADADRFVAGDLVAYVDGHYRTLTARISRGLAGASLGGDPALRVAMNRPDVFSSVYLLSASIVDATLANVEGSADNLRRYYSLAVNIGSGDAGLAMNRRLHDAMTRLRIPHYYEEFDGAHRDKASERIETRVLPFFSRNLLAPANPTSPAVK